MNIHARFYFVALLALSVGACAKSRSAAGGGGASQQDSQGILNGVVKVTAAIPVVVDGAGNFHSMASISNPVTIVNPSNVVFTLDSNGIVNPPIKNAMLEFGKLGIGELSDNNLRVCGTGGTKQCSKAYIQFYTTGTPGAGLWNTVGGYGMPIYANLPGSTQLTVGLTAAKAAVVQTQTIAATKNVLRLTDFTVTPSYQMRTDFTEAGAGAYSTTLVIEYGLLE